MVEHTFFLISFGKKRCWDNHGLSIPMVARFPGLFIVLKQNIMFYSIICKFIVWMGEGWAVYKLLIGS